MLNFLCQIRLPHYFINNIFYKFKRSETFLRVSKKFSVMLFQKLSGLSHKNFSSLVSLRKVNLAGTEKLRGKTDKFGKIITLNFLDTLENASDRLSL